MKIRLNSWRIYLGGLLGGIFVFLGTAHFFSKPGGFPALGYLLTGFGWLVFTLIRHRNGYFRVTADRIVCYSFPQNKEISLKDLKKTDYRAGDFIFCDSKKEIRLTREFIDKKDLAKFEEIFRELSQRTIRD